jgi:hypothetical protein
MNHSANLIYISRCIDIVGFPTIFITIILLVNVRLYLYYYCYINIYIVRVYYSLVFKDKIKLTKIR